VNNEVMKLNAIVAFLFILMVGYSMFSTDWPDVCGSVWKNKNERVIEERIERLLSCI